MKNKELIKIFNITLREIILFLLIMVINGLICIDSDIGLNTSAKEVKGKGKWRRCQKWKWISFLNPLTWQSIQTKDLNLLNERFAPTYMLIFFFSSQIFFCLWAVESLGLPLVQPYLGMKNGSDISIQDMSHQEGINFAISGAIAMDASFSEERGIDVTLNISLRNQLIGSRKFCPLFATHLQAKVSYFVFVVFFSTINPLLL